MSAPFVNQAICRRCLQAFKCRFQGMQNHMFREHSSRRKGNSHRHIEKVGNLNNSSQYLTQEILSGNAENSNRSSQNDKHQKKIDEFIKSNQPFTSYGHPYEKLKDGDLRLGRTLMKAKSSKESETILLEGQRLIRDAILMGAEIKNLYFCQEEILKDFPLSLFKNAQLYKIPYKDMKTWSSTNTPPGILGVFKKPQQGEAFTYKEPRLPLTLILDGLKDPGNVGTLLRTAAAVGCEKVLTLKGCAYLWEAKVLRSAMGGHFAVPIYSGLSWSQVDSYLKRDTQVVLADARTDTEVMKDFDQTLSAEQMEHNSSYSDGESDSESSSSDSDEDSFMMDDVPSSPYQDQSRQRDKYSRVAFPVVPYPNLILNTSSTGKDSSHDDVAVIIGSETRGLSPAAKEFAYYNFGTFVTIPMNPAVDSLNTAVAGSIILYDIHRKMTAVS